MFCNSRCSCAVDTAVFYNRNYRFIGQQQIDESRPEEEESPKIKCLLSFQSKVKACICVADARWRRKKTIAILVKLIYLFFD